jgi:hypothetical protein
MLWWKRLKDDITEQMINRLIISIYENINLMRQDFLNEGFTIVNISTQTKQGRKMKSRWQIAYIPNLHF